MMTPTPEQMTAAHDAYDASIECQPREHTQALFDAVAAALSVEAKPVACYVSEMKTTAGMDYVVTVRCGDRVMTPHMHKIRSRAEYEVAEWQWLFSGGEAPDILAYEEFAPPAPASSEPVDDSDPLLDRLKGRAAWCEDTGRVKDAGLYREAIAALSPAPTPEGAAQIEERADG